MGIKTILVGTFYVEDVLCDLFGMFIMLASPCKMYILHKLFFCIMVPFLG